MAQSDTIRDQILDVAESHARTAGYNGFSFRDLAAAVGIKSASVHYHFPTKGDLVRALMERYRERTLVQLGPAPDAPAGLERMIALFRTSAASGEMCLCGALGATVAALPGPVRRAAGDFSEALVAWLKETQDWQTRLPMPPESVVALLEGALLLSVTLGDLSRFENAIFPLGQTDGRS